jgi:MinD-like ATPase involved in chromosome partitioning or flagellar assembly
VDEKPSFKDPRGGNRSTTASPPKALAVRPVSAERTVVVPLSELLRRGQDKAGSGATGVKAVYAESTQLSLNPFLDQKTGVLALPNPAQLAQSVALAASTQAAAPPAPVRPPPTVADEPPRTDKWAIKQPPPAAAPLRPSSVAPPALAKHTGSPAGLFEPRPPVAKEPTTPGRPVERPPARAAARPAVAEAPHPTTPPRQTVVFFSCKGGSGATFLACNAAHFYARRTIRTCLFDLDLQLGDVLAALSLQPRATVANGIEMHNRGEVLDASALPQHRSGVAVLSQVGSLEDLDKVTPEGIANLIQGLPKGFDTIFVDGVRDFSETALAVLDTANKVVLIILQEVLAIRRGRWAFNILQKIGKSPQDVVVVVNRFVPEHNITLSTLKQMFAGAQIVTVGKDEVLVQNSLDRAMPLLELNARHPITKHIGELSNVLAGQTISFLSEPTEGPAKEEAKPSLGSKLQFWKRP